MMDQFKDVVRVTTGLPTNLSAEQEDISKAIMEIVLDSCLHTGKPSAWIELRDVLGYSREIFVPEHRYGRET
ncbi:hypothetical protein AVEN_252317-1, partial [Araneus ventricosus]